MLTARIRRLAGGLLLLTLLLGGALVASMGVGARAIPPADVWAAIIAFNPDETTHRIILDLRLPRTLVGLLVGAALGLAGAILQGATRNPLADPGILGIEAGATLFVVIGISVFGITTIGGYVWLAFLGAGAATVLVYTIAALGREGATPVKLALAGAAVTAAFASVTSAVLLTSVDTLDQVRFWQVGALTGRTTDILLGVLPFFVGGIVLALGTARILDGLALGDDVARGLGQRVALSRGIAGLAAVILAGAATAAAGPIGFVGLTVPHIARAITGPSYRWILPYSLVIAPIFLLGADIVGRIATPPGELQVGIVTAALGAPFFIALVRRRRLAEL
jgi:iron complex transport system permease protein